MGLNLDYLSKRLEFGVVIEDTERRVTVQGGLSPNKCYLEKVWARHGVAVFCAPEGLAAGEVTSKIPPSPLILSQDQGIIYNWEGCTCDLESPSSILQRHREPTDLC